MTKRQAKETARKIVDSLPDSMLPRAVAIERVFDIIWEARERERKYQSDYQRNRLKERSKRGMCRNCPFPVFKWGFCERHYKLDKERRDKSAQSKPNQGDGVDHENGTANAGDAGRTQEGPQ